MTNLVFHPEVDFLQNIIFDELNGQRVLLVEVEGFLLQGGHSHWTQRQEDRVKVTSSLHSTFGNNHTTLVLVYL